MIKGLAHITGGGLVDNLPARAAGELRRRDRHGVVEEARDFPNHRAGRQACARSEMFQVFNMGIGMAVILSKKDVPAFMKKTRAKEIGRIESGAGIVRLEP